MSNDWQPNHEQKNGVILRTIEFIADEVEELRQEIDCPPTYIANMLREIADNIENNPKTKKYVEDPNLDFYA